MFIPLFIAISLAKDLVIFPTVNELWINDLKDIFGSINNPKYELTPIESPFIIVESINLVGSTNHTMNEQPKSLVSNSQFTQFAVLDKQNAVYWTKQTLPVDTPQFQGKIQLSDNCFTLDFIDDSNIIIDCLDSKQFNLFTFLQQGTGTKQAKLLDKNSINQASLTFRKINVLDDDFVLLGQSSADVSRIDVYDLNSMSNTGDTLNTTILNKLAQINDKSYQFRLVDFICKFGLIYVLDENRLMILSYKEEWKLNLQIQLYSKGVAFDVNIVSDLNGNEKFELVILTQNGKLQYYNDLVSSPIEMDVLGSSIQISNSYVIIQQDQNLLQVNINDKQIVKQKSWSQNKFLVSALYSTLIEVEATFIKRYILSNGYIQGSSKTSTLSQSQIILKATYLDGQQQQQQIVSKLNYQFLENSDDNLYEIGSPKLFKSAIQNNVQYEQLDPFLSGPIQKYSVKQQQNDIILNFYRQVDQVHDHSPVDIVFQQTITTDQYQSLLVFQTKNLKLQFWGCSLFMLKSECLPLNIEINNDIQLTKNTFSIWTFDSDLYIAFVNKDNEIEIWEIEPEKISRIEKIKIKSSSILQILGSLQYIYVLRQSGLIEVFQIGNLNGQNGKIKVSGSVQLIDTINPPEPGLQIFNNPYHSSQILIVKTKTTIIVYRFNQVSQTIEYFLNYDSEVFISIYHQSFIVVSSQTITEYLMTTQQIRVTKQLPLYGYKLINQSYALQSKHNGLLFIPYESEVKINFLVYQPETLAHDSLVWILKTSISGDLKNIIMSVDGFQTSQFFYQYLNQNYITQISTRTLATSQLNYDDKYNDYCQVVDESFSISTLLQQQDFTSKLTIVNDMKNITIVDTNLKEVLLGKQNSTNFLSLGGDWYKGQVVMFEVSCKQCPQEIVLQEPIYSISYNFLENTRIITKFDDDHQVVVNKNSLLIYGLSLKPTLNIYLQQEYYSVAVHPRQNYIILAGKNEKNTNLIMISCKSAYSCSQMQSKTIQLSKINQMYLIQEDFLILSTQQELIIYHITYTQNSWTLEWKSTTNIATYSPCKGINYFSVTKIYTDNKPEYAVTLLDSTNQILFLFYRIKNGSLSVVNFGTRNLQNEIINQGQYAQDDTKYIQLLSYSEIEKTVTQFIFFKMIIITNNVATYGIQFQFDFNYEYRNSQILFIVNQYADWTTLAAASIKSNNLCIPYSNGFVSVLLLYKIPTSTPSINKPPTITSISGIYGDILPSDIPPIVYVFHTEGQYYYLITNLQKYKDKISVNLYGLQDSPVLAVSNTVELDLKQKITIFVSNSFSGAFKEVTLKSLYEPIKESASIGWIIAVIVIAGFFAIVMLFYVVRRRAIRQSYQNYQPMYDQPLRNI